MSRKNKCGMVTKINIHYSPTISGTISGFKGCIVCWIVWDGASNIWLQERSSKWNIPASGMANAMLTNRRKRTKAEYMREIILDMDEQNNMQSANTITIVKRK